LERDFRDARALDSYVLTQHAHECLERLAVGLKSGSTHRAWRLTGNYGSGKSSFALFLAHWFSGNAAKLSRSIERNVKYDQFSIEYRPTYLPLLVTGSREPMGKSILRALVALMGEQYSRGSKSSLQVRIEQAAASPTVNDREVVELLQEANQKLIKDNKGSGLLILLDEMGKFLEYAAHHPESQDIYLLQMVAEAAARSGDTAPLFVVGMLHQGFDAYAESLDPAAQREWEKVAGRFEEVVFYQPLVQISELVGAALRVKTANLPTFAKLEAKAGIEAAISLGWFGNVTRGRAIQELAVRLYPLHGTVVPAMVRAFSRFGQNERSLFSFLLSDEPFSLMSHARRPMAPGSAYRLSHFYDYVRVNFGHKLSTQSYRSHWTQIESMVESFATSDEIELAVVKVVGILNLLDHPDLGATDPAVEAALSGPGGYDRKQVTNAVQRLHKTRHVLFRRGSRGDYCLWPHTSVDLESAYERATKAVRRVHTVGIHLRDILQTRPLVARRHYIETGNLRYFAVRYCRVDDICAAADDKGSADGIIVVALCETVADVDRARHLAKSEPIASRQDVLVAIPVEPLMNQAGLVAEALRWEWVALNTPELNTDRFAREEVSRQRHSAHSRLETRIQELIGLRSLNGAQALRWFVGGVTQKISGSRQLLERLSDFCDEIYHQAPIVKNELINRNNLSSAAAAARTRLIAGVLSYHNLAYLGMDPQKKPPEMSMYMSVLQQGGIHVESDGRFTLQIPSGDRDRLRLSPCLNAIRRRLEVSPDQRVRADELLNLLYAPPYGVRSGLALLLLAVFSVLHLQELAFYEDGTFLRDVGGDEFLRLSKNPVSFELQLCRIAGVRAEVFESLMKVLGLRATVAIEPQVLDIVKPLCVFVAGLPDYVRNTTRLSPEAKKVRDTILSAKEPAIFLFRDLPSACGRQPFSANGHASHNETRGFAKDLKTHLDELRGAFDRLLDRIRQAVREEFNIEGNFTDVRRQLAVRAKSIVLQVTEPRLKALCLRLMDELLQEDAWLESLGSLLAMQPPTQWKDAEEDAFRRELHTLSSRFRSLESIAFSKPTGDEFASAFRLSIIKSDGTEVQQVVFVDKDRMNDVNELANEIQCLVDRNKAIGMAALSRVAWSSLKED
jgi:hypothetical protein